MFFTLWTAPAKIGEEVPHRLLRYGGQTLFPTRKTEETTRTEAASWRMAWKGERPSPASSSCSSRTRWWGARLVNNSNHLGSPTDGYFQHHCHNTQNTRLPTSDWSGSPWSTASSSFPDQKKKRHMDYKTKQSYLCEETEGNKSTSPDNIPIHHHAFCFPGCIVRHLPLLPGPHPRPGKTPAEIAPRTGDRQLFLRLQQ
jgi:hypothetical protein